MKVPYKRKNGTSGTKMADFYTEDAFGDKSKLADFKYRKSQPTYGMSLEDRKNALETGNKQLDANGDDFNLKNGNQSVQTHKLIEAGTDYLAKQELHLNDSFAKDDNGKLKFDGIEPFKMPQGVDVEHINPEAIQQSLNKIHSNVKKIVNSANKELLHKKGQRFAKAKVAKKVNKNQKSMMKMQSNSIRR